MGGRKEGRKEGGEYYSDRRQCEVSFAVDGVNYGVAYKGIPPGKPLGPCAILGWEGDTVAFIV